MIDFLLYTHGARRAHFVILIYFVIVSAIVICFPGCMEGGCRRPPRILHHATARAAPSASALTLMREACKQGNPKPQTTNPTAIHPYALN